MFKGLEHTAIASPDPGKLARWYEENLGFRINYEYAGNFFVRSPDGSLIEMIPAEGPRADAVFKTPGIRHLAIAVDNFDEALELLRSRHVKLLTEPYNNQGNRLVFFEDGDGNFLHLIQREQPLP